MFDGTLQLAGRISTNRSLPDLVKMIKQEVPIFFEFQAAALIFVDEDQKITYILNELNQDDRENMIQSMLSRQGLTS